ncbi:MAG TPA: M20/M25/M40 family metallo-hydrolase [Armatimonadota bacterium]|nr:M20/M25/M40 family metallo-hydrolase [Armatimonadota bacterium]
MADRAAIVDAVARRLDWGVDALRRLVRVDSVAPREAACQSVLAGLLREEGLDPELAPLPEQQLRASDGFIDTGLPLENRPNVIVNWGRGEPGARSLVLNSHIDTVSHDDSAAWDAPALSGEVRGGRVIGRGAVDAKGQIVAAAMALLSLQDAGLTPPGRVTLQSVVDEEPGGNGTLALCLGDAPADAAIVLEPTGNCVAYGHRGIMGLRFVVRTEAGHGAVAGAASGAIDRAAEVVATLKPTLNGWASTQDAAYGPPSLNVGRIEGGEDIFSTPRRCAIEVGLRYAPGTKAELLVAVKDAVAPLGIDWDGETSDIHAEVFSHYDAAETPATHALVTGLLEAARQSVPESQLITFPGGCDARHFVNRLGVPTVVFGAGELTSAHRPNEALCLDELLAASQTLACFITRWCSDPSETAERCPHVD